MVIIRRKKNIRHMFTFTGVCELLAQQCRYTLLGHFLYFILHFDDINYLALEIKPTFEVYLLFYY